VGHRCLPRPVRSTVLEALSRVSGVRADVCLIAEPTWLDLAVAHRGYGVIKIGLQGRAAHSSQPEHGVDVLAPLGGLLVAVAERNRALRQAFPHPLLAHGSLMSTVARGGSAPFTVAAQAEALIERRTLPGVPATAPLPEVRDLVDAVTGGAPGLGSTVELVLARDAWQADDSGPAAELMDLLAAALPAAGAAPPARTGAPYWMESALWQASGVPTVVCGPAGGGLHAVDAAARHRAGRTAASMGPARTGRRHRAARCRARRRRRGRTRRAPRCVRRRARRSVLHRNAF